MCGATPAHDECAEAERLLAVPRCFVCGVTCAALGKQVGRPVVLPVVLRRAQRRARLRRRPLPSAGAVSRRPRARSSDEWDGVGFG